MPWENPPGNNDKNPWGKRPGGDRNPWGSNGGRPGSNPPNMDEMLRKFQDSLKQMLPGGTGGGKIAALVIAGIALLWLASGFYIVQPGENAVIQRFGAWDRTKAEEGLGYHFPYPLETVTTVNVNEIRRLNIGFYESTTARNTARQFQDIPEESLILTSDRNIVDLDFVVQWNIRSAEDFIFNIQDQEHTIKRVAESAIREVVGQTQMFPIITTERDIVANRAKIIIQKNLDEYHSGVNITQVLIQQAEVHPDVQDAFQDVQSAKQDAEDVQNRAEAYREDILPKARGEAIQLVQQAQGYKQSTVARATGDAERFNSIHKAYLSGQDITRERIYIETMENILRNAQKIILDSDSAQGVMPYLPLEGLKAQQQQPKASQ